MRYSIMLQLVTTISVFFIAGAALFAWIQNRQTEPIQSTHNSRGGQLYLSARPPHPVL